ncbi:DNA adenine methylase [uncultured Methanolobus sp.]|uniref:DNA adenine methylase n=1 Tax=uncultured Methanolobus sp. TaxID=218300 RepID=UPI0029C6004E|nr:DNA adenine methylase [uncultured Methanolobus sp.]
MANNRINPLARPFLKWAGGKRQLLEEINTHVPNKINTYYEPFIGAGAVLFNLQAKKAVIGDTNSELINCYHVIKDNLDELIEDLNKHKNEKDYFYSIRELDRTENYNDLSPIIKASRIIYLNKTCYNGLFRVNSQGQFNTPFGKYKNPKIVDEIVLKAVSKYLNNSHVKIQNCDFEECVSAAKKGDFVYFDPPYDPVSDTASFTGYDINGFNKDQQQRLKDVFEELTNNGINCMLSNSKTPFITELYKEYNIINVSATRNINSKASKRGKIEEVLVLNYDPKNTK